MGSGSSAVTTSVIPEWDQRLLFKILDNIQDVVLVLDSDTTIVYANQAYARVLGIPVEKVLGRRLDTIEPNAQAITVLRSGKTSHNQREFIPSVGIHVIGSGFPLFDGNTIIGSVSTFYNISEVVHLTRELQRAKEVADYLQSQLNEQKQLPLSFKDYIGQNTRLCEVLDLAAKAAKTNSTVLIRGESGVGKEVLARAMHNCSHRRDKPLIKVNCAAIPESLLESELFGFEDGSFTGARKGGRLGKFELAHCGTIFLDEIGDMSLSMQAKILRVLQEKELERVGGTKTIPLDIRVIAATNRNLEQMITDGCFRRDLYYRLNVVPLYVLPLRERKDDIMALAQTFLAKFSEGDQQLTLSPRAMSILHAYDWPGNIRELQNVLEYASVVRNGAQIVARNLPPYLLSLNNRLVSGEEKPFELRKNLAKLERELILAALASTNDNRTDAIKALGISRRTFYQRLRQYGIDDQPAGQMQQNAGKT